MTRTAIAPQDLTLAREIKTSSVEAASWFLHQRAHLTGTLVWEGARYWAILWDDQDEAQGFLHEVKSDPTLAVSGTCLLPPQEVTCALPEQMRRDRLRAFVAERLAARG